MNLHDNSSISNGESIIATSKSTIQGSPQTPDPIGPTVPPVIQGSAQPPKNRKKLMTTLLLLLIVLAIGTFVYTQA